MPREITQAQVAEMADRWWPPELHACLHYLMRCSTVPHHHVRIPETLLSSKPHNANSVALIGWLDSVSTDGISTVRRAVGMRDLGLTRRQWEEAIQQLLGTKTTRKRGETIQVEIPTYLRIQHQGARRADRREILPTETYAILPPHTLDHLNPASDRTKISSKAFRLYATVHRKAVRDPLATGVPAFGWCELSTAKLAREAALTPATLRKLADELVLARLVVRHEQPGEATILLPLAVDPAAGVYEACVQILADVVDGRAGRTVGQPIADPAQYAADLAREKKHA